MKLNIPCPKCGNKVFKFDAEPTSLDDLHNATCSGCGHVISKDDIEAHALLVTEAQAMSMLKSTFGNLLK